MSEVVRVEQRDRVTVVTIDRPETRNALSAAVLAGLRAAMADFAQDPAQRVAILTGAGDRAFCSGADLTELAGRLAAGGPPPVAAVPDIAGVAAVEKPVIAAVNGPAVAGGLELALCCDLRIASEQAWFAAPEVRRGLVAGVAVSRLPGLVPLGVAMDLLLSADRLPAAEALQLGLVQQVVPPDQLLPAALAKAEAIAAGSPAAVRATKLALRAGQQAGLAERHQRYREVAGRLLAAGDVQAGVAAFLRKC